ncbi:MAG: nitrate- and nitrite sensing domain-containing protein, partial [Pollutimonas bauzanensis]
MQALMANLRMWQKFALIGVLALGMLAIPTVLVVKAHLDSVSAARAEAAGIAPSGAVLKLIQLTQQHRGMSAGFLAGDSALGAARQSKQGELDQALAATAAAVSASLGDTAPLASVEKIKRDWQALARAVGGKSISGPESFARHTALVGQQLGLLESIV